jgi:ferredoxin
VFYLYRIYPRGDWYGLLQPADIPEFLDTLQKGFVPWNRWRGCLNVSKYDQVAMHRFATTTETMQGAGMNGKVGCSSDITASMTKKKEDTISVNFVLPDGIKMTVKDVPLGKRLLYVAKENKVPTIEGVCDGHLECATCHLVVEDEKQFEKLEPPTDAEEDMLEYAIGRTDL